MSRSAASASRSADAVDAWEALREGAHEKGGRQADDVQVVAFDAGDECGAATLDRIGARAALPFAARDVRTEVAWGQRAEIDERRICVGGLPGRRDKAETGDDGVAPPGERFEHALGVARIAGLPVDTASEHDRRVDA